MSSTELSVLPVILRKPICRASANRFNGPRRSRTEASSSSSSVKKCSISSADSVSGNRSSPRYRWSHRLIGGFFVGLAAESGIASAPHDLNLRARRSSERRRYCPIRRFTNDRLRSKKPGRAEPRACAARNPVAKSRQRQQVLATLPMLLGYARVSKADDQDTAGPGQRPQGGRLHPGIRGEGLRRPLGPPPVAPPARPSARGRCARRVETRPPVALAQGSPSHPGEDRRRGRQLPFLDRGDRHLRTGRPHDDADARLLRRIRARHGARANPRRVEGGARTGPQRAAGVQAPGRSNEPRFSPCSPLAAPAPKSPASSGSIAPPSAASPPRREPFPPRRADGRSPDRLLTMAHAAAPIAAKSRLSRNINGLLTHLRRNILKSIAFQIGTFGTKVTTRPVGANAQPSDGPRIEVRGGLRSRDGRRNAEKQALSGGRAFRN